MEKAGGKVESTQITGRERRRSRENIDKDGRDRGQDRKQRSRGRKKTGISRYWWKYWG